MSDPGAPAPLSFHWAERESGSWSLVAFVLLSLLLHSAAFFLFQGKSPLTARTPRTAPAIRLLTPFDREGKLSLENQALLRWIATQDPALVASIPAVEPGGLLPIPYKPSFQTLRTQPLGVPPEPATIVFPPPQDPAALIRDAMPRIDVKRPAPVPRPTRISVSQSLSARSPADLRIVPKSKTERPVESTTLLAGVSDTGGVRFVFLHRTSGDPALDAEAADAVRALRFAPAQEPIQWGMVTFTWGGDAFGEPR